VPRSVHAGWSELAPTRASTRFRLEVARAEQLGELRPRGDDVHRPRVHQGARVPHALGRRHERQVADHREAGRDRGHHAGHRVLDGQRAPAAHPELLAGEAVHGRVGLACRRGQRVLRAEPDTRREKLRQPRRAEAGIEPRAGARAHDRQPKPPSELADRAKHPIVGPQDAGEVRGHLALLGGDVALERSRAQPHAVTRGEPQRGRAEVAANRLAA
jgi:hypothetical protein